MKKKLFLITGFMIAALAGLLVMLFHWGKQSVELREALFLDQVKLQVDDLFTQLEDNYYCFDLRTEVHLSELDSFAVPNPVQGNGKKYLELKHVSQNGEERTFDKVPIVASAFMQMQLHFEFTDIPEFKEDSSLTSFEKYIRDVYDQYLVAENGYRLVDTTTFDSLLLTCITPLFPEGRMAYNLLLNESNEVIFSGGNLPEDRELQSDVSAYLFSKSDMLPELRLEMEVVNKADLYIVEKWIIYLSAALLTAICLIFVFYLVRIQMQQKKMLQLQRDFIHGMTHEFNTPIANIKLAARNLFSSNDEKLRKTAEILNEEGRKLEAGINLVLTTALIEKEELLLEYEEIDVKLLLEKTVEKNRKNLSASGIRINLEIPAEELISNGDVFHLENVLQNLINNVRRHSGANELNITTFRENGHVNIRFTDNGRGIPEEDRKRIFGKFERTGDIRRKNGYGLGLYYSQMILQMHGGKIYEHANGHKGASFVIELPV